MGLLYNLSQVTAPAIEPVTLAQARLHLRLDSDLTAEDSLISEWITIAREWAEDYTGRAFVSQVWDMRIDTGQCDWASDFIIQLPKPPLISIDGIFYLDENGDEQSHEDYVVDPYSEPARLHPDTSWPTPGIEVNGLRIRFTAGYPAGSPDSDAAVNVPKRVSAAIKLTMTVLHENRGQLDELPQAAKYLLTPLRVNWFR